MSALGASARARSRAGRIRLPPMAPYVLRRIVHAVIVIAVVLTTVFLAVQVLGDPVRLMLPLDTPPAQVQEMRVSLGLTDPLLERFWRFVSGAVQGDFGESLWMHRPAFGLALDRLDATLLLGGCAIVLSLIVGVGLGLLAAITGWRWADGIVSLLSLSAVSIVEFWAALILVYVFAVKLGVLPTSGIGGVQYLVLPVLVLSMRPTGRIAQFTRIGVADELAKPYVRAATARGISRRRVVAVHALKNIAVSLTTLAGDELISVISTAVIVEIVFAWPGLGSLMVQSIQQRDLPLVEACVFVFTIVIVTINLVVDLSYGLIDRRARVT